MQKIGALQSARGIAALVVVVHHCLNAYDTSGTLRDIAVLSTNAAHGAVVFFFVLSGFVLGRSLQSKQPSVQTVLKFYVARFWRIYPALWLACVIALAYVLLLHSSVGEPVAHWFIKRFAEERMTALHVGASFAGVSAHLVPPAWSIFVELAGSVMLPFLWLASRARWMFICLLMALVAVSFKYYGYLAVGRYLMDFAMGYGLLVVAPKVSPYIGTVARRSLVLSIAIGYMVLVKSDTPALHLILSLASAAIVCAVLSRKNWILLEHPVPVRVGDISYSIYILHFPIMGIVVASLGAGSANPLALLAAGLTTAATLAASVFSYRLVELPGIRIGKTLNALAFRSKALASQ